MVRKRSRRRAVFAVLGCTIGLLVYAVFRALSPVAASARPLAYADSPYWSYEFIKESQQSFSLWDMDDRGFWYHEDWQGRWITFKGGFRVTTDQPHVAAPTLWLMGNSAVLGVSVPDSLTIPSQLQRIVGSEYRVVNVGARAQSVVLQLARLKALPVRAGDVVVWYDGVADVLGIGEEQTKINHEFYGTELDSKIKQAVDRYVQTVPIARKYTVDRHATFYHFVQTHMYSKPLSANEQQTDVATYPAMHRIFAAAWPGLQAAIVKADPQTIDLTHVLDPLRTSGVEIYVDFVHHTERGNAIVAAAIAERVAGAF